VLDVNPLLLNPFQKRITGGCPAGQAIQAVRSDGGVSCQSATGSLSAGAGITLSPNPITSTGRISISNPLSLFGSTDQGSIIEGTNEGTGGGVVGAANKPGGTGVFGGGGAYGGQFFTQGSPGTGVLGNSELSGTGVEGDSLSGVGVKGAATVSGDGVHGETAAAGYSGVSGTNSASFADTGFGGYFVSDAKNGEGVSASGQSHGVAATSTGATGEGVSGTASGSSGIGVRGQGQFFGVEGEAKGNSPSSAGVVGQSLGGSSTALAGYFNANVKVDGTLTAGNLATSGMKDFRIDDPLDPANKYLIHSSVESPAAENVYNGNITTDGRGYATVRLPGYFDAENIDPRYQLTVTSSNGWSARVVKPIADNRFVIQTDKPYVTVSWQVSAIRNDPYARTQRRPAERLKAAGERGRYLYPQGYGKGAGYAIGH
jgi:hypothetical protein